MASLSESGERLWGAESWIYQDLLELLAQIEQRSEQQGVLLRGNNIAQVHHSTEREEVYLLDGWCRVPVLFEFCSQTSSCDEDRRPPSDVMIKLQLYSFNVHRNQNMSPKVVVLVEEWEQLDLAATWLVDQVWDVNKIETIRDGLRNCHLPEVDRKWNVCDEPPGGEGSSDLSGLLQMMSPTSSVSHSDERSRRESWRHPVTCLGDLLISDSQKLVLDNKTDAGKTRLRTRFCTPAVRLGDLVISDSQTLVLGNRPDNKTSSKPEKLCSSDSLFSGTDPELNFTNSKSSKEHDQKSKVGDNSSEVDCCESITQQDEAKNSFQDVNVSSDDDIYIFTPHGRGKSKRYIDEMLTKLKVDLEREGERCSDHQTSQETVLISSSVSETSKDNGGEDCGNSQWNERSGGCSDTGMSSQFPEDKEISSSCHGDASVESTSTAQGGQFQLQMGKENSPSENDVSDTSGKLRNSPADLVEFPSCEVSLGDLTGLKDKKTLPQFPVSKLLSYPDALSTSELSDRASHSQTTSVFSTRSASTTITNSVTDNVHSSRTTDKKNNERSALKTTTYSSSIEAFTDSVIKTTEAHPLSPFISVEASSSFPRAQSPYTIRYQETRESKDDRGSSLKPLISPPRPRRSKLLAPKRARLSDQSFKFEKQTVRIKEIFRKDPSIAEIKARDGALLIFPDPVETRNPSCRVVVISPLHDQEPENKLKVLSHSQGKDCVQIKCGYQRIAGAQVDRESPRYSGGKSSLLAASSLDCQSQERDSLFVCRDAESFQSSPEAPGISVWPCVNTREKHHPSSTLTRVNTREKHHLSSTLTRVNTREKHHPSSTLTRVNTREKHHPSSTLTRVNTREKHHPSSTLTRVNTREKHHPSSTLTRVNTREKHHPSSTLTRVNTREKHHPSSTLTRVNTREKHHPSSTLTRVNTREKHHPSSTLTRVNTREKHHPSSTLTRVNTREKHHPSSTLTRVNTREKHHPSSTLTRVNTREKHHPSSTLTRVNTREKHHLSSTLTHHRQQTHSETNSDIHPDKPAFCSDQESQGFEPRLSSQSLWSDVNSLCDHPVDSVHLDSRPDPTVASSASQVLPVESQGFYPHLEEECEGRLLHEESEERLLQEECEERLLQLSSVQETENLVTVEVEGETQSSIGIDRVLDFVHYGLT